MEISMLCFGMMESSLAKNAMKTLSGHEGFFLNNKAVTL